MMSDIVYVVRSCRRFLGIQLNLDSMSICADMKRALRVYHTYRVYMEDDDYQLVDETVKKHPNVESLGITDDIEYVATYQWCWGLLNGEVSIESWLIR